MLALRQCLRAAKVLLLLGPRISAAEELEGSFGLNWARRSGAEQCVGARELAESIEAELGRSVFTSAARATVSLEGFVEATGEGYRAELRVVAPDGSVAGTRELVQKGADCAAFTPTLRLTLVLMIDAGAAARPPPAVKRVERPAPAPVAADCPEAARAVVPVVREPQLPDPVVGLGAVANSGSLPRLAIGVELTSRIHVARSASTEFSATVWLPQDQELASGRAVSRFSAGRLGAALCPFELGSERVAVAPCAGMGAGAIHVESAGLTSAGAQTRYILDFTGYARARVALSASLAAGAGLGAALPVKRYRFQVDDAGVDREIFETAAVSLLADLWLGVAIR